MRIFMLKVLIRFNRWVAQRYVTEEVSSTVLNARLSLRPSQC
jgi:hypothetical protein